MKPNREKEMLLCFPLHTVPINLRSYNITRVGMCAYLNFVCIVVYDFPQS